MGWRGVSGVALVLALGLGCDGDESTGDGAAGSGSGSGTSTSTGTGSSDDADSADGSDSAEAADATDGAGDDGMMAQCPDGPLSAPVPGCAPPVSASTGDPAQDCVDRINQLRWECQCLPPLQRWTDAESCSDTQSSNDQNGGGPHGNFGACGEFAQNTCPDWPSESDVVGGCLQAMWDEGPGEPFIEHGHYINMSNPDYTKVACGFSASSAGVWANQNFSG